MDNGRTWFYGVVLSITIILSLPSVNFVEAQTPTAKQISWRLQSVFSPGSPAYDVWVPVFRDEVNRRTKGQLKITGYAPGSLVKAPEMFDAVTKGVVEMATIGAYYWAGVIPEANIEIGLPLSFPEDPDLTYELFHRYKGGAFHNLLNVVYNEKGLQLVSDFMATGYGLMMVTPVRQLDDFKGKKLRAHGTFATLLKGIGVSPTSVDPAEQYMAMKTGVIDGTLYPIYCLDAYKFREVVKTVVLPRLLGTIPVAIIANLPEWKKLSPEVQKAVQEAVQVADKKYADAAWPYEQEVMKKATATYGVKIVNLPASDVSRLQKAAIPIWDNAAAKSPKSAELVNLLKEFLKEKGMKSPGE
jgi:TRAP-type C4-dicarboxylate transport system substrate-binding protein